ncbi:MAG: carbonic anhydrase [Actinobacteria bacterium]|nr:MAG: carbonic anhydrase [Actinomycetota bacterium]
MGRLVVDELSTGRISRRSLMRSGLVTAGGLTAAGALAACGSSSSSSSASTTSTVPVTNGDQALQRLLAGNQRFVQGVPVNQGRDSVRRAEVAEHQTPFAIILGCSDSRVPPEVLFDEGIGDMFLVRVAGNTAAAPALLGSIEYGAAVLHAKLLMVLGHEACGAVKATIEHVQQGAQEPGHIEAFVDPIVPAVQAVQGQPANQLTEAAIQQNVRLQVQQLSASTPLLAPLVSGGQLKVVGAEYHLTSGKVQLVT